MVHLSPGKTPARRGEADLCRGQREQRRPAAGCSHGKTHQGAGAGAAGEGGAARAGQPCHPRRPAGAGLLSASAPQRSSRAEAEAEAEARENKMPGGEGWAGDRQPEPPRFGCCAPACSPSTSRALGRGGGRPHAGHTQHCTRPLGSCGSPWRPAGRGRAHPRQWRGRLCPGAHPPHAIAYTHVRPDARPRQREGKPPAKGAEIGVR